MKSLIKTLISGLLITNLLLLGSCTTKYINVGSDTAQYVDGSYSEQVKGSKNNVYNAAFKAVKDNNNYILVPGNFDEREDESEINGVTRIDRTSLKVEVKRLADDASKVTIKFGSFGEKGASKKLMNEIKKNIK